MVSSGKPCNIDSDIVWDPLLFFTSWTANSRRIRYKNISEDCIRKRASLQQNDLKLSPLSFQSSKRERSKESHSKSFPIALVGLSNEEEINHRLIECNLAENAFPELPFFATELYRAMPYPYPYIASLVPRNGYNWNCFFCSVPYPCDLLFMEIIHVVAGCLSVRCSSVWFGSGRIGSLLMKLFCIKPWRHYSNRRGLHAVKNGIMRIRTRYSRDLFHCNSNSIRLKCT